MTRNLSSPFSSNNFSSGYVMLEFIIILPVFMMLIFMIVKFADMFWKKLTLTHAVYAAVQECSRARPDQAKELFLTNYNRVGIGQEATITDLCSEESKGEISLVTFSAVDTYGMDIPLYPFPQGITITETASMVKE